MYFCIHISIYLYLSLSHFALLGSARAFNKEGERRKEGEKGGRKERKRERGEESAQGSFVMYVCARAYVVCVRERERERERRGSSMSELFPNFLRIFFLFFCPIVRS